MKKKITALIMSAAVVLGMCGCDVNESSVLYRPIVMAAEFEEDVQICYLDRKTSKIAEKCFESIEYNGLKLALPMNVSDLPEGYTLNETVFTGANTYNGYCLVRRNICRGDEHFLNVQVLYKQGESIDEGQIVSMEFMLNGFPDLGEGTIPIGMSYGEICELLGQPVPENEKTNNYFVLNDGRVIKFYTSTSPEFPPAFITLSVDSVWGG